MASPTERCQGRAILHANHMMVSIKALCIPLAGNGDDGFLGSRCHLGKKDLPTAWPWPGLLSDRCYQYIIITIYGNLT